MKLHKVNFIEKINFIAYVIYIVFIAVIAYSDRYYMTNNLIQGLIRITTIGFSFSIPFIYRFILNIKFKKTIFIPILIIALVLDILYSLFTFDREHQVYRILIFLSSFPLTYLIFISNLQYKNIVSSNLTKLQIKITFLIASIISIITPTYSVYEKLPFVNHFGDSIVSKQYNSSSIEIYYITILIIYASFLRMKMFINRDNFKPIDNIINLIILIPTIKLMTITYSSISGIILSLTALFCFYCFSFFKINTKNLFYSFFALIPLMFWIFKDKILTTINIILEINNSQLTSAFLVRLEMLSTILSPIYPFVGEGSCPPTLRCNHAHNVFTDLSITLGIIGLIVSIIYIYILIKSFFVTINLHSLFNKFEINSSNYIFFKRSNLKLYFLAFLFYIFLLSISSEIPFYWATFSFLPFIYNKSFFNHIFYIYDASKDKEIK